MVTECNTYADPINSRLRRNLDRSRVALSRTFSSDCITFVCRLCASGVTTMELSTDGYRTDSSTVRLPRERVISVIYDVSGIVLTVALT